MVARCGLQDEHIVGPIEKCTAKIHGLSVDNLLFLFQNVDLQPPSVALQPPSVAFQVPPNCVPKY